MKSCGLLYSMSTLYRWLAAASCRTVQFVHATQFLLSVACAFLGVQVDMTLSLTLYLLNIASAHSISGGFDYHEPINTDVLSCGYSLPVTIPVGDNGGSGIVTIINDTIYEGQEEFYLDLSVAPEFQTLRILEGSPLRATVQIEDDDSETECFTMLTLAQVYWYLFQDPQHRMKFPYL